MSFELSDEAVDWIETVANHEDPADGFAKLIEMAFVEYRHGRISERTLRAYWANVYHALP